MKNFLILLYSVALAGILCTLAITTVSAQRGPDGEQRQSKVIVKSKPKPHYPKGARKRHIEATVVLRAIFRASGEVTDIKFDKIIPGDVPEDIVKAFTDESIKAARKIKFQPATKGGRPVSMYIQLEYAFLRD